MRTLRFEYGDVSYDGHSRTESIDFVTDLEDEQIIDIWKNAIIEVGFDYLNKFNYYESNLTDSEKSVLIKYIDTIDRSSIEEDFDEYRFEDIFEAVFNKSMVSLGLTHHTFMIKEEPLSLSRILGRDYWYIGYGKFT